MGKVNKAKTERYFHTAQNVDSQTKGSAWPRQPSDGTSFKRNRGVHKATKQINVSSKFNSKFKPKNEYSQNSDPAANTSSGNFQGLLNWHPMTQLPSNPPRGKHLRLKHTEMLRREEQIAFAEEQAARSELLLPEDSGILVADEGERTRQFTQKEIAAAADITSATKYFNLDLGKYGPYTCSYTRNGRHLVLGGQRGHVAAMDWVTKSLLSEINVMESVHKVKWLHVETMFAAAQKEWVYIYDNQGIELHCLKKLDRVLQMEFLPYHFILATSNEKGILSWLDISIGQMVTQTQTRLGRLDVMCQNPYNAVLCLGHSKGIVSMWTPNMKEPAVKMLCHKHPVRAVAVDAQGLYMATSSTDRSLKIWDVRNLQCVQSYRVGGGASHLAFSQRGLLAVSLGNIVEVYRDCAASVATAPYLRHRLANTVTDLEFCPFEDVLGIGHSGGFTSMLVPGAGEPNFDALESNPFQTKKQRHEAEVKALLEKIQPELITLDPSDLGDVDLKTLEDKLEAKKKLRYLKPSDIDLKPRRKKKKKGGTAKEIYVKKVMQNQERQKFVKDVIKSRQDLKETEPSEDVDKPLSVLDRFVKKAKVKKTEQDRFVNKAK